MHNWHMLEPQGLDQRDRRNVIVRVTAIISGSRTMLSRTMLVGRCWGRQGRGARESALYIRLEAGAIVGFRVKV